MPVPATIPVYSRNTEGSKEEVAKQDERNNRISDEYGYAQQRYLLTIELVWNQLVLVAQKN